MTSRSDASLPMSSLLEEETEEPLLKYERLSSDLKHILAEDEATRLVVHPKLLVLATKSGQIHVLDAFGHAMRKRSVQGQVLDVDMDHDGEAMLVVTDKQIYILGVSSDELNQNYAVPGLVGGSIDPIYSRPSTGRRFMSVDKRCSVLLHERGLFNRLKSISISPSIDVINSSNDVSLKWRGRFAAWNVVGGVRVFDVLDECIISLVKIENKGNQQLLRIVWIDQFNFIISSQDQIKICRISRREKSTTNPTNTTTRLPSYKVTITRSCRLTNRLVCGVAAFNPSLDKDNSSNDDSSSINEINDPEVVALTLATDNNEDRRPHLMILRLKSDNSYVELADDVLSVHSYENCHFSNFRLESLPSERLYFVVCPKDVVLARTLDLDDRISFLTSCNRVLEAFNLAERADSRLMRNHDLVDLGHICVDVLLEESKIDEAVQLCPRFCNLRAVADNWQRAVFKFARAGQLKALAPVIPIESSIGLESQLYEMILFDFLKTDTQGMLELIRKWPSDLYNTAAVSKAVVEQLLVMGDESVVESNNLKRFEQLQIVLAILFFHQSKFEKALAIYLKLGVAEEAFSLLRRHPKSLLKVDDSSGANAITQLMELDPKRASVVLLELRHIISSEIVVDALSGSCLFFYLDALINQSDDAEESYRYHNKFVELLALFAPERLMSFLRSSDHYSMESALRICERHELTHERVFILARMGATRQALRLITHQLTDIQMAVQFCKQHTEEPELWTDLINYALNKPYFVTVLLRQIGTHVMDPRNMLIARIPEQMAIPGLRDSLAQIMHDFRLQLSLQQGCQRIIDADCSQLITQRLRNRAIRVTRTICAICQGPLIADKEGSVTVLTENGKTVHTQCLGAQSNNFENS